MYHKLAKIAADICLDNDWILSEQYDWCVYAFEKRINAISMFTLLLLISVLTKKVIHTFSFVGSLVVMRRRIGGWHSKSAWSCQLISISVVFLILFIIGPQIYLLNLKFIVLCDAVILLACAIIRPKYPAQLHFTNDVVQANNKKKYIVLSLIVTIQISCCILQQYVVLIYSFLGTLVALIALIAEWADHFRQERLI